MEPRVTRPLHGTVYKKLGPATGQQASTLVANHGSRFLDPTDMKLFADGLCSDLKFCPNTSEKFEAAINELAWFLGISGQRPEKLYDEGPDNLWALPNGNFLVIECKNGVTAENGIAKKDAGQLGQSMEWFAKRYSASKATPIMIHPERKLGQGASSVNGMRVIDDNGLKKLRKNLKSFAQQLVEPDISRSASEVAKRLAQFELNADAFANAFSGATK